MIDAVSILVNDTIDKVSSTSASSLMSDKASSRTNDILENIDSTLVSSRVTDVANIDLTLPLLPFPNTSLSFNLHCITGINFTYHQFLYHNHSAWIESIILILQILFSSFHLKYVFLFSHHDSDNPCPFEVLIPFLQSAISSWNISTPIIFSNNIDDNISFLRSFLFLSALPIKSPSIFTRQYYPPSFSIRYLGYHLLLICLILVPLLQTILLIFPSYLTHRFCSIIPDLKGVYSRILMVSPPYRPLSLILFIQSQNRLIFFALIILMDDSVSFLKILFIHSCSFSLFL